MRSVPKNLLKTLLIREAKVETMENTDINNKVVLVADNERCRRRGSPNWRCKERVTPGKSYCMKHHLLSVARYRRLKERVSAGCSSSSSRANNLAVPNVEDVSGDNDSNPSEKTKNKNKNSIDDSFAETYRPVFDFDYHVNLVRNGELSCVGSGQHDEITNVGIGGNRVEPVWNGGLYEEGLGVDEILDRFCGFSEIYKNDGVDLSLRLGDNVGSCDNNNKSINVLNASTEFNECQRAQEVSVKCENSENFFSASNLTENLVGFENSLSDGNVHFGINHDAFEEIMLPGSYMMESFENRCAAPRDDGGEPGAFEVDENETAMPKLK